MATKSSNLYKHVRYVHGIKYKCNKCGKEFNHSGSLTEHNKAIHEGFLYDCNECDQKFKYRQHLRQHIKIEHRGITSDCTICGRKCSNDSELRIHVRTHDNPNMFCKMCDYSCRQNINLKKHVERMHGGEPLLINYPCHICDLEAESVEKLRNHIVSEHSKKGSKEEIVIQPKLEENSPSREDIIPKQE